MIGDIQHENILDEVGMEHKSLQLFYKFSVTEPNDTRTLTKLNRASCRKGKRG